MNVVVVAATYAPIIGGAETYAVQLVSALTERGHDVRIITDNPALIAERPNIPGDDSQICRLEQYRRYLGAPGTIWWETMYFGPLVEVQAYLDGFDPDLVVSNSLDSALLGAMLAKAVSVPHAAAFHEQEPESRPLGQGPLNIVYGGLGLDLILAGSNFYADRALRYGAKPEVVRLIRHGVDTRAFSPNVNGERIRRMLGLASSTPLISSVGRLTPRKGHGDLIDAFSIISDHPSRPHLLIAGTINSADPAHAAYLRRRVVELDLIDRVTFNSQLLLDDMPEVYSASQIVAQLSWAEGFGFATLEAMSSAVPVVATDIAATREILTPSEGDPTISLVPVNSPLAAAHEIAYLLDQPETRLALGRRAREFILSRYRGDNIWARTVEELEQLVLRRRAQ